MKTKLWLAPLALSLLATACTTTPPQESRKSEDGLDITTLQRALHMDRSPSELGYEEKSFNTCEMNFGPQGGQPCRQSRLVVVNFLLQCRDSQGTTSNVVMRSDTKPIRSDNVRWNLGSLQGETQTDSSGYGSVVTLAPSSQKKSRLKLTINGKFMILTAEDMTRVVAPSDWCSR